MPPQARLRNLVLLPILGDHYGRVLEAGEIQLGRAGGRFEVRYHERAPHARRRRGSLDGLRWTRRRGARWWPRRSYLAFLAELSAALPEAALVDADRVRRGGIADKEVLITLLARLIEERLEVATSVDAEVGGR